MTTDTIRMNNHDAGQDSLETHVTTSFRHIVFGPIRTGHSLVVVPFLRVASGHVPNPSNSCAKTKKN